MASLFWVGGTATWDGVSLLHWSTSSGGAPNAVAVPGSGDTVTFDGNSGGGTVTVNTDFNITSLTMGTFTGTLDFSANNNSPTMQTFSGTGTGTRTLNMGSGTWTITGNNTTIWTIATTTNLTLNPGSAVVNCNYSGSTGTRTISGGTVGACNFAISAGSDAVNLSTFSCINLNFSGYTGICSITSATCNVAGNLTFGIGQSSLAGSQVFTLTATTSGKTITSNAVVLNRGITCNGVSGVWTLQDNIDLGTGTLTLTNGDFEANNKSLSMFAFSSSNANTRVLTMGSGTWTITGNNTTVFTLATSTGLTFTEGGGTINFTYSGSTGTRSIALSAAGLLNTSLKISAGTDIIAFSANNPIVQNLDFTGFTGTYTDARSMTISGNYTLGAGMTASASGSHTFVGTSGTQIMTSNGVTQQYSLACGTTAVTGTSVQLADDLIIDSTHTLSHSKGILNTNNKNVTAGLFSSTTTNTRTLTLGSSLITLTGTGTIWNLATTTGLTFNANTSTIKANDASASTKMFSFGALTYYNLYLTGGGTGVFQLGTTTSSKTFNGITVDPPLTVQVFAGSTLVLSSPTLLISGNGGQLNTFQSTTNGQTWTISSVTGTFNENYISLQDSIATGGGTFYAGAQSTSVSGNTGWIFTDAPDQNQNAKRDANMVPVMLAVSSEDGVTVIPVYADANSHALFVMPF